MSVTKEVTMNVDLRFGSLLGVAFVVLKLTHVIAWSWIWVLAPFWIPLVVTLVLLVLAAVVTSSSKW